MKKYDLILIVLLCSLLSGCFGRKIDIELDIRKDPTQNYSLYRQFAAIPIDKTNPLLEKNLLLAIISELQSFGYRYNAQNPDFYVMVSFKSYDVDKYVPPETRFYSTYTPGNLEYKTGFINSYTGQVLGTYSGYESTPGKYTTHMTRDPGYYTKDVNHLILISFFDAHVQPNEKNNLIWSGSGTVTRVDGPSKNRLDKFGPFVIRELLKEFPHESGGTAMRSIRVSREELD